MKTEYQIMLCFFLILFILIWRLAWGRGYAQARWEIQQGIEKSGALTADGLHFYRVEKIDWHEPKPVTPPPLFKAGKSQNH